MTSDTMNLHELLETTTDADFLLDMICNTAQRLVDVDVEVEALTGAAPDACSPNRVKQRNGSPRSGSDALASRELATAPGSHAPALSNCTSPGVWPLDEPVRMVLKR